MRRVTAADLFCGAGGTSTGLAQAAGEAGLKLDLTAINHWDVAVETHSANHPGARHLCESLDSVDPRKLFAGMRLDLLLASPECTNHSIARGGKPAEDQSRATAWHVVRWAEALRPRCILVENVREFADWGPLGEDGRPLKKRKGDTFRAWIQALESLNYRVQYRRLNAADYGAATSRTRLFVVARRGKSGGAGDPFPEQTHARDPAPTLFGDQAPWRAAREVIDWGLKGSSIFDRKRPLSANTLRRIEAGLRKFGGDKAEPFLAMLYGTGKSRSIDEPLPTITAQGGHVALAEPFGVQLTHGGRVVDLNALLPTITTAKRGEVALVEPFLVPTNYGEREGQNPRCHSTAAPLPTIVGSGTHALVEPFLVPYYGTGGADPCGEPLRTLTTRDRLGLAEPTRHFDILFRMLQPHELSLGMGFPAGYRFSGNRGEVVKQIGNAVEVNIARRLCGHVIARHLVRGAKSND